MESPDRIVVDPRILVGKPVVKGTRIAVALVMDLLAHGCSEDEILADYPQLAREDIRACLAYANESVHESPVAPPPLTA
jgi:uncharacterized protein (DUF433 family)